MSGQRAKQIRRTVGISTKAKRESRAFVRSVLAEFERQDSLREREAVERRRTSRRRRAILALFAIATACAALLRAVML